MSTVPRSLVVAATMAAIAAAVWRIGLPMRATERDPGVATPQPAAVLRGLVSGPRGPVSGATVRWQGHPHAVHTGPEGDFVLPLVAGRERIAVSAEGHYVTTRDARGAGSIQVWIDPLPVRDSARYRWVDPTPCTAEPQNCGNCHQRIHAEWLRSAHARSATNPRLRDLIEGRTADGRVDLDWSLRGDHPHGVAVCNACHAPTLEPADPHWESPTSAEGVASSGVHCDFCHKVQAVDTALTGLKHGRYAMQLLRPADRRQVVFGPLDDTQRDDTAAAAVYRRSEYCGSCHEGTVFGIQAYATFSEWQASPAGRLGRQCQDCHMAAAADVGNMAPGRGGIDRDAATLSDHSLCGDASPRYRDALVLTVDARPTEAGIRVNLMIDAAAVGHAVPTGFVDRHVVLLVDAADAAGLEVAVLDGPRIPVHAGESVAGRPGCLFAKTLTDSAGRLPAPLWAASAVHADTRIKPDRPHATTFIVDHKAAGIRVRLLHRGFWESTRRRKRWDDDTTVILDAACDVPCAPVRLLPRAPRGSPEPATGVGATP